LVLAASFLRRISFATPSEHSPSGYIKEKTPGNIENRRWHFSPTHQRRLLLQGYEGRTKISVEKNISMERSVCLCAPSITNTNMLGPLPQTVTTKQSHIARTQINTAWKPPRNTQKNPQLCAAKHALNFLITPGYKSADAHVRTWDPDPALALALGWLSCPMTTAGPAHHPFRPFRPPSSFAQKLCKLMFT